MPDLSGISIPKEQRCLSPEFEGERIPLDGSDADYQFALRFLRDCDSAGIVHLEPTPGGIFAHPTTELLDLISEGITETAHSRDRPIPDQDFARDVLRNTNNPTDPQKRFLSNALQRYIRRIDEYRLCFDVHFSDYRGRGGTRRMTKNYKTRFNSDGRIAKQFAKYNAALEDAYASADNAVLVTLTSDPGTTDDPERPDPRSLLDLTESINPNFHRLTTFMASDPSTKADTRDSGVRGYRTDLAETLTSRPRERLDYIKVLEFSSRGLPHLHVLFFDVPTDESGMPLLMNKQELSDKWSDYGQGLIVDVYPLVYREDLADLEPDFASEEGFVDWYRFGDNDLSADRIEEKSRSHQIDMAGTDENPQQKTAGAYLGKYLSVTFGGLAEESVSIDEYEADEKLDTWKLACYWATNRKFWTLSRELEERIKPDDDLDHDLQRGLHWAEQLDVKLALEAIGETPHIPEGLTPEDRARKHDRTIDHLVRGRYVHIEYIGTFRYDDLPSKNLNTVNLEAVDRTVADPSTDILFSRTDRPPPIIDELG